MDFSFLAGAPRFDVRGQEIQREAAQFRKAGFVASDITHCEIEDIVDFFTQYVSEYNPNKDWDGKEVINHVAERVNKDDEEHPAAATVEQMMEILKPERTYGLQSLMPVF